MSAKKVLMLLGAYDQEQHLGIARAARQFGWHLDVSLLKTFRLPARWKGDGILCSLNNNNQLVDFVRKSRVPAVDTSIWRAEVPLPRVVANNPAIGRVAAEHFLQGGHRHYVWFALERNPVGEARRAGFTQRLLDAGIPRGEMIRMDGRGSNVQDTVVRQLRALPKPCAIFTKSDLDSAWLLNACLEAGLSVPKDAAILGVDNNALICENQPVPLSSINHDLERIGFEGARLLNELMNGAPAPDEPLLIEPTGIAKRQSTDTLAVSDPIVRKALEYMESRLRVSIGVDDIARAIHVPRRNLEARFRQTLRVGVHGKLLELRLQRAESMLRESTESIENISALTGFANAPHLSRTFKKCFGLSPIKLRQAFRARH